DEANRKRSEQLALDDDVVGDAYQKTTDQHSGERGGDQANECNRHCARMFTAQCLPLEPSSLALFFVLLGLVLGVDASGRGGAMRVLAMGGATVQLGVCTLRRVFLCRVLGTSRGARANLEAR